MKPAKPEIPTQAPRDDRGAPDEQAAIALSCYRSFVPILNTSSARIPVRDWRLAAQALERHGLLPALAGMGAADGPGEVPAGVRQSALEAKLRTALHHLNALDALKAVSGEMREAGIPYAVLKGPYLYEWLYRDLFPRAYGDIDLLVPADRIGDARSALGQAGYAGDPAHASMPRWHFHAVMTSNKPGGLPLELHRSLVDKANLYRIREKDLFERLADFEAREGSFTVLSREDQFLYLCLHAAKHGILNSDGLRGGYAAEWYCRPESGNRLLWFLDIELFLRKEKDRLDWASVSRRAREWNVETDVADCLCVLNRLQPGSPAGCALERMGGRVRDNRYGKNEPGRRQGLLSRLMRSKAGQSLLERSMRTHPRLFVRPVRLMLIWQLMAPSPARLLLYHGRKSFLWLPWLYLAHPFHMIRKLLVP